MNLLKGRFGPISLRVLSAFRNADTQPELENAIRGIINLHVNSAEISFITGQHSQNVKQMVLCDHKDIQNALKTGELLLNRVLPRSRLFRTLTQKASNPNRHDASWKPNGSQWRWEQFLQIAAIYGFGSNDNIALWTALDENGNLVFFPFATWAKTLVVWNTWINECWWCERLTRMKNDCNRDFDKDLNVDVLMLMHYTVV